MTELKELRKEMQAQSEASTLQLTPALRELASALIGEKGTGAPAAPAPMGQPMYGQPGYQSTGS